MNTWIRDLAVPDKKQSKRKYTAFTKKQREFLSGILGGMIDSGSKDDEIIDAIYRMDSPFNSVAEKTLKDKIRALKKAAGVSYQGERLSSNEALKVDTEVLEMLKEYPRIKTGLIVDHLYRKGLGTSITYKGLAKRIHHVRLDLSDSR